MLVGLLRWCRVSEGALTVVSFQQRWRCRNNSVAELEVWPFATMSMGWLCGGVIWFAATGSVTDSTPIWERTGCGFQREDNGRTWRTVVRRFRQDGEGKTWSAVVVVSISWIRVSGWAWAQLLSLSGFITVVLFKELVRCYKNPDFSQSLAAYIISLF
ncbi:hypothetical protein ACLB2K_051832 [Fragaria x ananassa]